MPPSFVTKEDLQHSITLFKLTHLRVRYLNGAGLAVSSVIWASCHGPTSPWPGKVSCLEKTSWSTELSGRSRTDATEFRRNTGLRPFPLCFCESWTKLAWFRTLATLLASKSSLRLCSRPPFLSPRQFYPVPERILTTPSTSMLHRRMKISLTATYAKRAIIKITEKTSPKLKKEQTLIWKAK